MVEQRDVGTTRLFAIVTGLLGFLLAVAAPLLPVEQTKSSITWPQNDEITNIEAPLISYHPQHLDLTVPWSTITEAPPGVIASTIPPGSPDSQRFGLSVRTTDSDAEVVLRNSVLWSGALDTVGDTGELRVVVTKNDTVITSVGGDTDVDVVIPGNQMPTVVGVFTDLTGTAPTNLNLTIDIDSRFSTHPTTLKILALTLGVLTTITALIALHKLDLTDGRRHRRFLPANWWKLRPLDITVGVVLLSWYLIGANTADDGYILTMARVANDAG
ncbi:arabinosyltransferase domain-containing protein, partial [Hoyosella rhizosphaerae]